MAGDLLIGCGHRRVKTLYLQGRQSWNELVTLDINPDTGCDIVHDLNVFPYPFQDNTFSEIHAYEVLEHTGKLGDAVFFFKQFEELHRILEPDGFLFASVPRWNSLWAFGDPSHTRVISEGSLSFLSQKSYEECATSARTDFRSIYKADFEIVHLANTNDQMYFILKAIK